MSLLGIDLGTSGCKALLFGDGGHVLAESARPYGILRERPGQAELDVTVVWQSVCLVIKACAAEARHDPVRAVAVASMGEAFVPVDRRGRILGNSPLGCDTRGLELAIGVPREELIAVTGQPPGPGYALYNLCRLQKEEPGLYRDCETFLFWADFVAWKLTGVKSCSAPLASRTLLYDLHRNGWSERIAEAVGFDPGKLAPVVPSGEPLGMLLPEMARKLGLPPSALVVAGTHDQCAAALGAGAIAPGDAMLGLGTYACMVLVHDSPEFRGMNLEPHAVPGKLVSFLYHGSGGSLLEWLRREMFRDLEGPEVFRKMEAELAAARNRTPVLLPYFAETGPLDYAPGGEGVIAGLSFEQTRGHLYLAALEATACYFRDNLARSGLTVRRLALTGGGSRSAVWRRLIADFLELPVRRPETEEAGALGCALLAAAGAGLYAGLPEAVAAMVRFRDEEPREPDSFGKYAEVYRRYLALKRKMSYIPE